MNKEDFIESCKKRLIATFRSGDGWCINPLALTTHKGNRKVNLYWDVDGVRLLDCIESEHNEDESICVS